MLHGLMGSGACWTPVGRALENDFDVIMPDTRGRGDSSAPHLGYRYDDLASDVVGLLCGLVSRDSAMSILPGSDVWQQTTMDPALVKARQFVENPACYFEFMESLAHGAAGVAQLQLASRDEP